LLSGGGGSNRLISARKATRRARTVRSQVATMKKEYDFSRARKNPYARRLKRQVTIRLDEATIRYFKVLARENSVPYQTLINLYLRDCAISQRRLSLKWKPAA
jgi:uncharacterized protein (DUF4415 family)